MGWTLVAQRKGYMATCPCKSPYFNFFSACFRRNLNKAGVSVCQQSGLGVGWNAQAPLLHHGFYQSISPWILPRSGKRVGKRHAVTSDILLDCRSNFGKRVRLTRKTRPSILVHDRDPGHPTPRRWMRLLLPGSFEPGEIRANLAIFFLVLVLG